MLVFLFVYIIGGLLSAAVAKIARQPVTRALVWPVWLAAQTMRSM